MSDSNRVNIRFEPEQKRQLDIKAAQLGVKLGVAGRRLLLAWLDDERDLPPPSVDTSGLDESQIELLQEFASLLRDPQLESSARIGLETALGLLHHYRDQKDR